MSASRRPLVVVLGQLDLGGSERQLLLFLQQADRDRWAPHVYVWRHWGTVADQLVASGIPVTRLTGSRTAKVRQLRRATRASRATYVSWSSWTNVLAWVVHTEGLPRIGAYRNAGYLDLPERARGLWSWASRAPLTTILCNSTETTELLRREARSDQRVLFVPNAVEAVTDTARARDRWRRELGVAPEEVLVMGIGRLTPQKRFDRFVDAVALCSRKVPVRAVIVGPDYEDQSGALTRHIAASGMPPDTVRWVGPLNEAREAVCAADVLLLSSLHEGMPNVVLEAMSAGVPCVTTPVGGVTSLITSGVDGLVADHDACSLAAALSELACRDDLRETMGRRARLRIAQRSPETVYGPVWRALEQEVDAARARRIARFCLRTRVADVALCLIALPVVLPILGAAAAAVRLSGPGPVLHHGVRVGRAGRTFRVHKIRTMRAGSSGPGLTLADDARVTALGRWLRRARLDELPQLWNVLVGDMGLVGPRPEDPRYVDLAQPMQRAALEVRPGLTGLASLCFLDEAAQLVGSDWECIYRHQVQPAKLALDLAYIEQASLLEYARVLLRTGLVLLGLTQAVPTAPAGWDAVGRQEQSA